MEKKEPMVIANSILNSFLAKYYLIEISNSACVFIGIPEWRE
jgi:hypothetical protein